MAKKKKHKSKKSKHNNKVVKNSTENIKKEVVTDENKEETKSSVEATKQPDYVSSDVKFSFVLLGAIVLVFVALYLILQNKSISDSVYGIIKIKI